MNSIIFLVVNTVCKLFSYEECILLLFLNCLHFLSIHCSCFNALTLFSQSDFFHLIVTGILIGYRKTIKVLLVLHLDSIDRGTYYNLLMVLCGFILNQMGVLYVGAWANHKKPDERFWSTGDISGNRHACKNPSTCFVLTCWAVCGSLPDLLVKVNVTWCFASVCFRERCLRGFS